MSYICSSLGFGLGISIFGEPQADTVHTMPLIRRCGEPLAFENVSKMTTTVIADNFSPLHAKGVVHVSLDGTGNRIKVSRPSTAWLELVIGCVKWRITASAVVHTLCGIVRVIFTSPRRLGALFTEDLELFCIRWGLARFALLWVLSCDYEPGLRTVLHCSSERLSGNDIFSFVSLELLLEPNSAPRNEKVGAARSAFTRVVEPRVLFENIE